MVRIGFRGAAADEIENVAVGVVGDGVANADVSGAVQAVPGNGFYFNKTSLRTATNPLFVCRR